MNPTKEQIQWFWEQCGLEYHDGYFYDTLGKQILAERHILTLDNLFKYAVPKLLALANDNYPNGIDGRHYIFINLCGWLSEILDGRDPALALFWAIYKAFGGEE